MDPSVGAVVHQPTVGTVVQQPTVGTVVQQSSVGTVVQQPTVVQQSTVGTVVQQPTVGTLVQQPNVGTVVQQPTVGTVVQQSNVGTVVQQSNVATVIQQPTMGTVLHQPTVGTVVQRPHVGTVVQQSNVGTVAQQHSVGTVVQHPTVGTVVQQPTVGTVVQQSAMVGTPSATGQVAAQSTYVAMASSSTGHHTAPHNQQPSGVIAGTLIAKPGGMSAPVTPVTMATPVKTVHSVGVGDSSVYQNRQPGAPAHYPQNRPQFDPNAKVEVLSRQRLQELVKQVDPNEQLDEEVEELLLQMADDFIESTVSAACRLAKHRHSSSLDVRDVQLYLERNWNMKVPGFGAEEIRAYKRSSTTEAHKQRVAIIRKALKKY